MSTSEKDPRLERLLDGIVRIAAGDLQTRIVRSTARDELDAVITGINLLTEDLQNAYHEFEERVETRTAMLQQAHLEMERMAMADSLTSLCNRTALASAIHVALDEMSQGEPAPALLLLDLNSFKAINDTHGHAAGDEVLKAVAARLCTSVRATDTVARLGGDEFAIMLPRSTLSRAKRVAHRVLKALSSPIELEQSSVHSSASMGLAMATPDLTAEELLLQADTAMYAAKVEGRSNVKVFEPLMLQARRMRSMLGTELRIAIDENQLVLHYQPVVELATGRIEGVEALVRWNHPGRGLLMPDQFIPLAEEIGVIDKLGQWVRRTAIRQLSLWQMEQELDPRFTLRINVSATELQRIDLMEDVRESLADANVNPSNLIVEITESAIVAGNDLDRYSLKGLRLLGVNLEIDDFGTGYSSISYLRRLPVNVVKVDKSLIVDIATDPVQQDFIAAILQLIRACGLEAVFEGIETKEQRDILLRLGCVSGQGYYFSRPLPAKQITGMLGT